MENLIEKSGLVAVMIKQLKVWNDEKVTVAEDTVHKEVLSTSDGIGGRPASASMYQWSIMWTVDFNGGTNAEWPENWLDLSLNDLADYIISKQPV